MTDPTPEPKRPEDWHNTLPFPKRWIYYIIIKLVILVLVIYFALHYQGLV